MFDPRTIPDRLTALTRERGFRPLLQLESGFRATLRPA